MMATHNVFSTACSASIAPCHRFHSASPSGNPPCRGNLPPSRSPRPTIRATASLIPIVPHLTTSFSAFVIRYCNSLISEVSALPSWLCFSNKSNNRTVAFGKAADSPSIVPAPPILKTGNNCCPNPVNVRNFEWSMFGFDAMSMWSSRAP